jgi:2-isopropylmalate synthase
MNMTQIWPKIPRLFRQAAKRSIVSLHRSRDTILISDTTLRDGEQMPGIRLTLDEKLAIARALDAAGVHSIDAGFAACSEGEIESIRAIAASLRNSIVTSLCRTMRADIDAADRALEHASPLRRGVSLFVGTSPLHRGHKLKLNRTELLRQITDTVSYAASRFEIVAFSPEDASRTEIDFLCECYRVAIDAGASTVGFPDTVGILTPEKARDYIRRIQDGVPNISRALLAVHFHNDLGLAVANSLACVSEGVHIVQGTIGGIGERAGNAALEEVVLALKLHSDQYDCRTAIDTSQLTQLCQLVFRLTGIPVPANKPICGSNIFATEAGIHQDGLLKHPDTYLPYRSALVGGPDVHLVLGKHSGRRGVAHRLGELGVEASEREIDLVLMRIKELPKDSDPNDPAVLVGLLQQVRTVPKEYVPQAPRLPTALELAGGSPAPQ